MRGDVCKCAEYIADCTVLCTVCIPHTAANQVYRKYWVHCALGPIPCTQYPALFLCKDELLTQAMSRLGYVEVGLGEHPHIWHSLLAVRSVMQTVGNVHGTSVP